MNSLELDNIIKKIVVNVLEENNKKKLLPKLYIFVPEDFNKWINDEFINFIKEADKKYDLIFIKPDQLDFNLPELITGNTIINRSEFKGMDANSKLLFLNLSLNLLSKTALLIPDEFESKWIIEAISSGNRVYVRENEILYSEVSPLSLINKIKEYKNILKDYGISFHWKELVCSKSISSKNKIFDQKKLITAKDVEFMDKNIELKLNKGDIITLLAVDKAKEKGIRVIYP